MENQRVISALHEQLGYAAKTEGAPSLSAEWLLDNHYIIQEQIEDVKTNLGRQFYAEYCHVPALARRAFMKSRWILSGAPMGGWMSPISRHF